MPAVFAAILNMCAFLFNFATQNTIFVRNLKYAYNALKSTGMESEIFATMDSQDEKTHRVYLFGMFTNMLLHLHHIIPTAELVATLHKATGYETDEHAP